MDLEAQESEVLKPSLIQNNDQITREEQNTILAVMQKAKVRLVV